MNPDNIITYSCRIHLNVVLPSTPSSSVWFFFSCFPSKNICEISLMSQVCHMTKLTFPNLITLIIFGKRYISTERLIIWLPPFPNIQKDHSSFRTLGTTNTVPHHRRFEPSTNILSWQYAVWYRELYLTASRMTGWLVGGWLVWLVGWFGLVGWVWFGWLVGLKTLNYRISVVIWSENCASDKLSDLEVWWKLCELECVTRSCLKIMQIQSVQPEVTS